MKKYIITESQYRKLFGDLTINEDFNGSNVEYYGLFIDEPSKEKLKSLVPNWAYKIYCDHMTLAHRTIFTDEIIEKCESMVGKEFDIYATEIGVSDDVIAVGVETNCLSFNKLKHITLCTLTPQSKPVQSNYITDWRKLKNPILLRGTVKPFMRKSLNEAMDNSFRFDELRTLNTIQKKLKYCRQHLGKQIGKGSSRICFQIDDKWVLKLAYNIKGLAQNKVECENYQEKNKLGIFPLIYGEVSDLNDYSFIVSEYVLQATVNDFKECFNVPYPDFCEIIVSFFGVSNGGYVLNDFKNLNHAKKIQHYFKDFHYILRYEMTSLRNLGLVNRNGEPLIVILDSGLDDKVYRQHYGNNR